MSARPAVAIVGATLLLAACRHKPIAPPPVAPPPQRAPVEGKTAYAYLFDPTNPALGLPADVRFDRPNPVDTKTLPVYPPRALADRFGPHREIVRILLDTQGRVADVRDSPLAASDRDAYSREFRKAVEEAVRTWEFSPGVIRRVEPGNDVDGDGKPDYVVTKSSEMVPVYYDVRFTFEIVEGKGVVRRE